MKLSLVFKMILCLLLCYGAAGVGSLFMGSVRSAWYANLIKPGFMPPGWLFGPVWTVLYTMMGISLFLVWRAGLESREVKAAVGAFLAQLLVNAMWTPVFFGWRMPGAALAVIGLLWLLILSTMLLFLRVSRGGAWLLVPYLAWVSFALVLNAAIVRLN